MIVNAKINKDVETRKIRLGEVNYVPTWVNKYPKGNNFVYEIIPLFDALANRAMFNLNSDEVVWRAQNSENNTTSLIDGVQSKVVHAKRLSVQDIEVISKK